MKTIGITMGDSSGVGPEILLKSAASGELKDRYIVYGDLSALSRANRELGFGLTLRAAGSPDDVREGDINVVDHRLLSEDADYARHAERGVRTSRTGVRHLGCEGRFGESDCRDGDVADEQGGDADVGSAFHRSYRADR